MFRSIAEGNDDSNFVFGLALSRFMISTFLNKSIQKTGNIRNFPTSLNIMRAFGEDPGRKILL